LRFIVYTGIRKNTDTENDKSRPEGTQMHEEFDVIVVGAGNAALAAAVSAKENGADRVVVLEKAPREMRGGNTHWSGGVLMAFRPTPRKISTAT